MEETYRPKSESRMKRIFREMENSEVNIQTFYEELEKEFGGYCPFSKFKSLFESFYPQIDKSDIIYFLSKVHLNSLGNINLTLLFTAIARSLNKEILSLKLVFYNIAYTLGKKMKITTKEFFYKLGFQMQTELNVNDFISKVVPELKLTDYVGIAIFKCIDIKKRGVITVQDLVTVIDSYRNDSVFKKGEKNNISGPSKFGNYNISESDFYWLTKLSNKILDQNSTITPKMLFDISKINNEEQISLDILKRKLKSLVFKNEVKADELNFMINALNINGNYRLSFEEFNELLLLPKKQSDLNKDNNEDNKENINNKDIISQLPMKNNYMKFNNFFDTEELKATEGANIKRTKNLYYQTKQQNLQEFPLFSTLIDQKSAISHLHCNSDLDLWVSTSIDGNINLYTLPLCKQARTIKIGKKCSYSFLTSSPLPCIVVICDETDNSEIIVYSLNGKLITNKELYFKLSNPIIIKNLNGIEYLAYIGKEGISIHYLPTLELLFNKDIGQNIHTIFTSEDKKCLYCVNRNGNDIYLIREEIKKNIRNASMALMNSL